MMARACDVDFARRRLQTERHALPYDYLVLAMGSSSSYFGIPGAEQYTFPLKTMEEGVALRNQILSCFEQAAQESDLARRQRLLTFVIVGGGPTGVEYAGALAELIYGPLCRDYRGLTVDEVSVVLVEMMDTLLAGMPPKLGRYALERLRDKRVTVRLKTAVAAVTDTAVHFEDGESLATETVVWTAGVRGAPLAEQWGLPADKGGRIKVLPTLQAPEQPRVYVIGDLAAVEDDDGKLLPMLAPVAMQQGEQVARNILRQVVGQDPLPFRYRDKGTMATVGRSAAVAHIFDRAFTGFFAWLIWLGVHLFQLIGFRNRLVVLINWAWSYIFFERVVRLIMPRWEDYERAVKGKMVDDEA